MKLWQKDYILNNEVEKFTVGNDPVLDQKLIPFDCEASIAHAKMLKEIGILKAEEEKLLIKGLQEIISLQKQGKFVIQKSDEDCHTAIENYLTKEYGDVGEKIHTGRSRNDQVLTALRLYEKDALKKIEKLLHELNKKLAALAKKEGETLLPGYTHMQKAMPTTIKMWLECFIASFSDSLIILQNTYTLIDASPLGTGTGYGIPVFSVNRKMTADLLGFGKIIENPIYAQMTRGKYEIAILHALTQIMYDINKFSTDLMLFTMNEFGYIELPSEFCTGSSVMPQKKNPDVLELLRGKYHIVLGEEYKVKSIVANLMSGYNRDMQLTKEPVMASLEIVEQGVVIMCLLIPNLKINREKCSAAMTSELYATEEAYALVKKGMPFRQAYKEIGKKYS
ncbi:argininosuccinate lyase [Candidatus Woesearchaeota archaeon]|nr:argininosuccinate lyase [Candidatus Woesearchaeota archaeon]